MPHLLKFVLWFLMIIVSNYTSYGKNILGLFAHPGFSHFHSFYPILNGLTEHGHNLTIVTYFSVKNRPANYNEILIEGELPLSGVSIDEIGPSRSIRNLIKEYYDLEDEGREACRVFYESKSVIDKIRKLHDEKPFDLTLTEVFNTDCVLGVVALLRTPVVGLSSCALMPWHYDRVGLPDFPAFIPSEFVASSFEMDFMERAVNFFIVKFCKFMYRLSTFRDNDFVREQLGLDIDLNEAAKNTSLILLNQHYSLSGARPLSPRVIEIGGAHIAKTLRPLEKELENFLNGAPHGVVFISWGSMVNFSSVPPEVVASIVKALTKLDTSVIWKWEIDEKPVKNSKRILFSKWVPQLELLCHPKVKLFWSHGGLLGTSESVHCAVPMVITPMYGDQYLNAEAIKRRKMGEILPYEDIAEETVFNIISKVLQPSYSANAKYVSDVFRNRQNPPLDTALWWIEHVLNTGGSNLTYSPSVELNWFVYYSLDVISTLIGASILILAFIVFCIKKICKLVCCRGGSVADAKLAVKKKKKTS